MYFLERKKYFYLILLLSLLFTSIVAPAVAAEKPYPTRPVTIYSGMAAGAAAGISAQIFADTMQKYLDKPQPFLVNFKPGAGGMLALDYVAKQPADGYTLFWMTTDNPLGMAMDPSKFSFTLKDFDFIGMMAYSPFVLAVQKDSPYKTFADFVEFAKKHPGDFTIGLTGIGAGNHLVSELLMEKLGIKLTLAPFAGGAPAITALLGGHVNGYIGSIGSMGGHLKPPAGGLRALVNFDTKRAPELPDVPTYKEVGVDVEYVTYMVLMVRKGTPKPTLDLLVKAFKQVATSALVNAGFVPNYLGPAETEKRVMKDYEMARRVFKNLGLSGK
jgi:tripartite-type tricarboxylate transporter receptor subunit TctC